MKGTPSFFALAILALFLTVVSCTQTAAPTAIPTAPRTSTVMAPTALVPAKATATRQITPMPSPTRLTTPAVTTAVPSPVPTQTSPSTVAAIDPAATLREAENANRPLRDLADLAIRLKGVVPSAATPVAVASNLDYQAGRQDSFWVSDQKAKTYFTITATIAYVTPHAYFYVQNGQRVSPTSVRQAADAFEQRVYPLAHRYFGSERPGPNGDAKITVLNGRIPNVGGYFSSEDQYPRSVSAHSNERNIVYINTDSYPIGTQEYNATLAHELQHLISWTVDRTAETWFNEGCSEFAMQLAGYDPGGAVGAFANDPNTQLTAWSQDDSKTIAHYGAGYLFLNYFASHYGGYDRLPELLAAGGRGAMPFENYLKTNNYGVSFDDVFRDWVIANYLDDQSAGDRYWYKDVNVHARGQGIGRYPFRRDVAIEQYAAQYFELSPGPGDVTVSVSAPTNSTLLDNSPKNGLRQWWSNRGDLMDTTITREFDLTSLSSATLRFSTWYDIEDGFDYAYVEASADGGKTWATLPGRYTTSDDPVGQNLGHGYTGRSGGGDQATWLEEEVDLRAYVGKKVLLRFEHVTDDAYNAPGFAVDDISIPERGFLDDAEAGDSGWQAIGFVRTANVIPQPVSVQIIEVGQATKVETIPVGPDGKATFTTKGLGGDLRRAVLVIAPMAPVTTEPAQIEVSIAAAA